MGSVGRSVEAEATAEEKAMLTLTWVERVRSVEGGRVAQQAVDDDERVEEADAGFALERILAGWKGWVISAGVKVAEGQSAFATRRAESRSLRRHAVERWSGSAIEVDQ